jgi:hypothetical protein
MRYMGDGGWVQGSRCEFGACVEARYDSETGTVRVRDSKQRGPGRVELTFDMDEWAAFTAGVRAGEFDFDDGASAVAPLPTLLLGVDKNVTDEDMQRIRSNFAAGFRVEAVDGLTFATVIRSGGAS